MLEAPYALLALLALPILVWIHRRRLQGVPVDVPSLLFLDPEPAEATAPQRRRFDAELALALAAAACLALAAAGPRVAVGAPKPVVRVVLDASPAMEARATATSKSAREQAEAALAALGLSDSVVHARGKPTELLAVARRDKADVRIVVSDRATTPAPPDVHVAAYGDPAAENVGIVAAHGRPGESFGSRVFATVWNHSASARTIRLSALGPRLLEIPANSARSVSFDVAAADRTVYLATPALDGNSLQLDDAVVMHHDPLRVDISRQLPEAHRLAVEAVLGAVVGPGGFVFDANKATLFVARWRPDHPRGFTVVLDVLPTAGTPVRVLPTPPDDFDPILAGVDAGGAECLSPPGTSPGVRVVERERSAGEPVYTWRADPLAGFPAPVDTPAWPVFWANVVEHFTGGDVGAGWKANGVLDPDVTRLGRDRIPIDPAWIADAKTAAPAARDLRLPLVAGGALCLLLLWFAPRGRRVATVG